MYTINLFNRSLIITLVISSLSPMRMGGDTVMVGSREEGLDIVDISRLHSGKFFCSCGMFIGCSAIFVRVDFVSGARQA